MFISSEISVVLTFGSPKSLNSRSERSRMRSRVRRGGLRSMVFGGGNAGSGCGKNTAATRPASGGGDAQPAFEVVERVGQGSRGGRAGRFEPKPAALAQALHQRHRFVAQHVEAEFDAVALEQRRQLVPALPQLLAGLLVRVLAQAAAA